MTVLIVVLVIGGGVAAGLVLGGGGSDSHPSTSPSATSTASSAPATRVQAKRFARRFAQVRIRRGNVDAFVTQPLLQRYVHHDGGLDLYRYAWANKPPADITGYSIFHVEDLKHGNFLVALEFRLAGASIQVVREEDVIVGPGRNSLGKDVALVVRDARLPGS